MAPGPDTSKGMLLCVPWNGLQDSLKEEEVGRATTEQKQQKDNEAERRETAKRRCQLRARETERHRERETNTKQRDQRSQKDRGMERCILRERQTDGGKRLRDGDKERQEVSGKDRDKGMRSQRLREREMCWRWRPRVRQAPRRHQSKCSGDEDQEVRQREARTGKGRTGRD